MMDNFKVEDGRTFPFFQVDNRLIDDCDLDTSSKLIYVALCRYSNNGSEAFPSFRKIADVCGINRATAIKKINLLVEKKYISKTSRFNEDGSKSSNVYTVLGLPLVAQNDHPSRTERPPLVAQNDHPSRTGRPYKEQVIKNNSINNNLKRDIVEQSSHIEQSSTDAPKNAHIEIIDYLNQTCGTAYRTTSKKTQQLINARLKEGFTIENFKVVIYKMNLEWKADKKMNAYLRPETLFGPKFESYLNRKEKEITLNDVEIEIDYDNLWG